MPSRRCDLCQLYGCMHVNPRLPPSRDAMSSFCKVEEETPKITSTLPMGPTTEANAVIIPQAPKTPMIHDAYAKAIQSGKNQVIDMKDEWVHCNLCKANVYIKYLDDHLKIHINQFEPTVPITGQSTSSLAPSSNVAPMRRVITPVSTTQNEPAKKQIQSIRPSDSYKFRQLEQACCASSVSRDGRYSDFTIIFWEKEKPTTQSVVYHGGSTSYTSKDWERFCVHVVYDSLEDYYTFSAKLMRRSQYSSWDNEDVVPDRICFQNELFSEIKRAMLFFRISPLSAYRHFRKLFNKPIAIDYDSNGRAVIVQSQNCDALNERLKKESETKYNNYGSGHHDCG